MPEVACRLCFEEECDPNNPLLSPCLCTGNSKYIHELCLQRWRRITTNPLFRIQCEICLAHFHLPSPCPLEQIPLEGLNPSFEFTHLMPFCICMKFFLFMYLKLVLSNSMQNSLLVSDYATINIVTYLFFRRYIQSLRNIHNITMYRNLWFHIRLESIPEYPLPFLVCVVSSYFLAKHYTLFFILYILLFPHLYSIHINILRQINITSFSMLR